MEGELERRVKVQPEHRLIRIKKGNKEEVWVCHGGVCTKLQ